MRFSIELPRGQSPVTENVFYGKNEKDRTEQKIFQSREKISE